MTQEKKIDSLIATFFKEQNGGTYSQIRDFVQGRDSEEVTEIEIRSSLNTRPDIAYSPQSDSYFVQESLDFDGFMVETGINLSGLANQRVDICAVVRDWMRRRSVR